MSEKVSIPEKKYKKLVRESKLYRKFRNHLKRHSALGHFEHKHFLKVLRKFEKAIT